MLVRMNAVQRAFARVQAEHLELCCVGNDIRAQP